MKYLNEQQIQEMRDLATSVDAAFGERDRLMDRYDEIYFMENKETPSGLDVDEDDIKYTTSSSGRDAVTGLKRILDTAKVHVKIKGRKNADKLERGLKKILEVSGMYRQASIEKDLNLSTILHGPGVAMVESVDDMLYALEKPDKSTGRWKNEFVAKQLETIRTKTPFLLRVINARQSYPIWGEYGMVGHLWKYTVKGNVLRERWGVNADAKTEYVVRDLFHYEKRLVMADGISDPLLACEWVTRDDAGEIVGNISIPIFARYAGGTGLFHEPERQMQPLLYAKAMGEWDKRETLFWTYLFTALDMQGLPGPLLLLKPDNANQQIKVNYAEGLRYIVADGQLADPQVIDGDVLQIKRLMDGEAAMNTIQPQTLGQNTGGVTFSQFALASKAGLIPAQDPKEALEALYKDMFEHMLHRIKHEGIENDLIPPADIPYDGVELVVTIEPDMEQDDLRNAQIAAQLRAAGANVSDEWINTNLLKIADSEEMFRAKSKEDIRKAMLLKLTQDPAKLEPFLQIAMGEMGKTSPPQPQPQDPMQGLPGMGGAEGMPTEPMPGAGGEMLPKTDPMIPAQERM